MKKRILGLALALCLIVGLLPAIALADAADTTAKDITIKVLDVSVTEAKVIPVAAGQVLYATTNPGSQDYSYGKLGTLTLTTNSVSDFTETNPGDDNWKIKIDNTKNPAVLTLKGAEIGHAFVSGSNLSVLHVSGEGALEVVVAADSKIEYLRGSGIWTAMAEGTTYTSVNNAQLTINGIANINVNCCNAGIRSTAGDVTIKNANIYAAAQHTSGSQFVFSIENGNLIIEDSTIDLHGRNKTMGSIKTAGDLVIKNSDVFIYNWGISTGVDVAGAFTMDATSSLNIYTTNDVTSEANPVLSKMPATAGQIAKYMTLNETNTVDNTTSFKALREMWDGLMADASLWTALTAAAGEAVSYNLISIAPAPVCKHPGVSAQTDCSVAVVCSTCGATVYEAKEHTFAADDGDCSTAEKCTVCGKVGTEAKAHTGGTATCTSKAVCSVCNKEYGELAAHTPKEGTYTCDVAHPCAVCDGNYREAGAHVGGGTAATCQKKAVCTCGAEYGELAACTPAADDGNCTTAINCSVCGKEVTAAKEHKYTDTADTTCDNAGCAHTRTVESGDKNPQTGDNTMIVLMSVLSVLAATAFVFTKKNAII